MEANHNGIQVPFALDENLTEQEETETVARIQYALRENQVIPYYQGLYNNQTKAIDKYEALMRLRGQDGTIYQPRQFMAVAKKHGLYLELNLVMFRLVLEDFTRIDCPISLNLSPFHLSSPPFCDALFEQLSSFYKPENITLEILEDECAIDTDVLLPFMERARAYGVKIAIDDFGTGYSNLLSILKLSPDFLKIDGSIVQGVHNSFENQVIMESAANMGQRLNISLVAEFVENADIQEVVERNGIMYSQGYYFSMPQPFEKVYEEWKSYRDSQ